MSSKKMVVRKYNVRFNTPAFLGNAEQNGQWRTPPFKAALRQWWRVAWAAEHDFNMDLALMREQEGRLFGSAANGDGAKSLIRLRLGSWQQGDLKKISVGNSYLAYGKADIKGDLEKSALKAGSNNELSLAFPEEQNLLDQALRLMNHFGTVGGRSRNGWGSMELNQKEGSDGVLHLDLFSRDWQEALNEEWAHALGRDEDGLLLWCTKPAREYEMVMNQLSALRKEINQCSKELKKRHWITRPIDGFSERFPSTVRFKVRCDEKGKFYGVIFHMPCMPPEDFRADKSNLISLWQQVHGFLDQQDNLTKRAL